MNEPWWIDAIKAVVIVNLLLGMFAYMTWVERKLIGRMQQRYGPNRVGPFGLLQPIADLVKLIRKESFFPATAVDILYITAPMVSAATALAAFSVIPFGAGWHVWHYDISGEIMNVPISLIFIFALGSLGLCVTLFFGGWIGPWSPLGPLWFLLKVLVLIFLFIWLRATLPRLRYDQLMAFGWKVLLPLATVNAVVTAALVVAFR